MDDLSDWVAKHPQGFIFLSADLPDPYLLDLATRHEASPIAVLTDDPTPSQYRYWLRLGASVVDATTTTNHLHLQVNAALRGCVALHTTDARALATRLEEPPSDLAPDPRQIAILGALAAGATLQTAANLIARSERHTRRLLHNLLDDMDISSSHAAITQATRWGWIPNPPAADPSRTNLSRPGSNDRSNASERR
ncbi:MAG: hypothetical protein GXP34_10635 [Actinobacteria bacterium]|nr:hypothetical protein [Actinomycetota bacterium]